MNKRDFIKRLGLGIAMVPTIGLAKSSQNANTESVLPKPLRKGDWVGLVSPSAATSEKIQITFAVEALEALGFKVLQGKNLFNRRGHLAGSDQERAADINEMFSNPDIKAVICIRGGSGAARILPMLDYDAIRNQPKPLLGYSDITALHLAIYAQTGLITFHGPNGTGSWNKFNVNQFEQLFFEQNLLVFENELEETDDLVIKKHRTQTIFPGKTEGTLIGGNLTVMTALAGSPYLPDFKDKILFLEDIGEEPYRIDRMMSTLHLMGALDKIKGFIFGYCTDCGPSSGFGNLNLDQIFEDFILPLKIPAYRGAMIGHEPKQFILPVGGKVAMDAEVGKLWMTSKVF